MWVIGLIVLCIMTLKRQPMVIARFSLAAIPTGIIIISQVFALLLGQIGPVRRTAPSFVYFFTLYNLYVIILMIGYWPMQSSFKQPANRVSENTPIFGSDANYSEFATDKQYIENEAL